MEVDKLVKDFDEQYNLQGKGDFRLLKAFGAFVKSRDILPATKKLLEDLHAFNQLNNRIVSLISQSSGLNAEKMCSGNGIVYNIIKDNPVPSIDNKDIKMISNALIAYGCEEEDRFLLLKKLQNGVETDNEQPKCNLGYDRPPNKPLCDNGECNKAGECIYGDE